VPVTARLSRKFYETFGEDVTNELVDWFNAVDLTYRADLRELNEMNFARFDATLERRVVELDTKFERRWTQLDARFDRLEVSVDAKLDGLRVELIKWMFLFWVGSVGLALSINALG
jgi:transposase-like protein